MQIPTPSLETIEDFMAQKRIAMIGVSRNPKDFSAALFDELRKRGYDMVPVNPKAGEVLGLTCFARVQEIQPPVDVALLMTTAEVTDAVVSDGQCPFMFLTGVGGIHKFHGFVRKITGRYPKHQHAA